MNFKLLLFVTACVFLRTSLARDDDDDDEDLYTSTDPKKREPSPCEICKFFVTEFQKRLDESSRSKEVIETGHGLDKKKRFKYVTSELRLTEALHEPHICENILEYNVHAEREGSLRYAKGMSETFQTLHGLVDKGVKVELGIPYDLWDKPSAEVTKMHRKCFNMAEYHEDDIEEWYYNRQEEDLLRYLCADRYLPRVGWADQSCLEEEWTGKEKVDFEKKAKDDEEKRKQKEEEKRQKEEEREKRKKREAKQKKLEQKRSMKGDTGKPGTQEKHASPPPPASAEYTNEKQADPSRENPVEKEEL